MDALERNHRYLNEYLRSFTNAHQTDWDDSVAYYEFCYNTTPHMEHGYTPFELVFGRKALLPQDINNQNFAIDPVYNTEAYYNELKYKLQVTNKIAREELIHKKEERTIKANTTTNPISLEIGNTVYITNHNRKKLDPFYIGPFAVINIDNPNCTIKHKLTGKENIVHKNRLIEII